MAHSIAPRILSKPALHTIRVKAFNEIPGPWPSLPIVGTNWQYWGQKQDLFQLHKSFEDKLNKYGPICKEEYQFRRPVVHLFDAEHFSVLFRSQGKCPIRPPNEFVCKYRRDNPDKYSGVGLSNALGEEWHSLRSALAPVLKQIGEFGAKGKYEELQWQICQDWVQHLTSTSVDGQIDDIQDSIYMLALESIFALCLEQRLGCFKGEPRASLMVQAAKDLFESYQKLYYGSSVWKKIPTRSYNEFVAAESTLYRLTSEFLAECSASPEQSRVLKSLMSLPQFSWKDIHLTVMDFLAGGIFTMTQSLTFFVHRVAVNKRAQDALIGHVDNLEHPANHPYVKACLKEVFRISPSVPGVMRILPQETVLCDYQVPAGTAVFANSMIACRSESLFPQASEFIPERWLNGRPKNPFALLPFGFGARMCPGRHFAELEMCSAITALLKSYEISSPLQKIPLKYIFVIAPDGAVPITLKRRV